MPGRAILNRHDPERAAGPSLSSDDRPPFAEPWQAEAFALVVALVERGVFTWPQWAEALSREVHSEDAAADGNDYYEHWLRAVEALLSSKGIAPSDVVDGMAAAWQRAAHATPHGQPIRLENDPYR